MSELIDRVARAIYEASPTRADGGFSAAPQDVQERVRAQARAALEAMREPSRAMVTAGEELAVRQVAIDEAALWRTMMAAALERDRSR
jgi:CHASE3 domain sensor protein